MAADGSPSDHDMRAVPKRISVRTIRLDRPPARILKEVDALAAEIPLGDDAETADDGSAPSSASPPLRPATTANSRSALAGR